MIRFLYSPATENNHPAITVDCGNRTDCMALDISNRWLLDLYFESTTGTNPEAIHNQLFGVLNAILSSPDYEDMIDKDTEQRILCNYLSTMHLLRIHTAQMADALQQEGVYHTGVADFLRNTAVTHLAKILAEDKLNLLFQRAATYYAGLYLATKDPSPQEEGTAKSMLYGTYTDMFAVSLLMKFLAPILSQLRSAFALQETVKAAQEKDELKKALLNTEYSRIMSIQNGIINFIRPLFNVLGYTRVEKTYMTLCKEILEKKFEEMHPYCCYMKFDTSDEFLADPLGRYLYFNFFVFNMAGAILHVDPETEKFNGCIFDDLRNRTDMAITALEPILAKSWGEYDSIESELAIGDGSEGAAPASETPEEPEEVIEVED